MAASDVTDTGRCVHLSMYDGMYDIIVLHNSAAPPPPFVLISNSKWGLWGIEDNFCGWFLCISGFIYPHLSKSGIHKTYTYATSELTEDSCVGLVEEAASLVRCQTSPLIIPTPCAATGCVWSVSLESGVGGS